MDQIQIMETPAEEAIVKYAKVKVMTGDGTEEMLVPLPILLAALVKQGHLQVDDAKGFMNFCKEQS